MEYVGEVIDDEIRSERLLRKVRHHYQMALEIGEYLGWWFTFLFNNIYWLFFFDIFFLDPSLAGNYGRFLNHSCDPNCETQKWDVLVNYSNDYKDDYSKMIIQLFIWLICFLKSLNKL